MVLRTSYVDIPHLGRLRAQVTHEHVGFGHLRAYAAVHLSLQLLLSRVESDRFGLEVVQLVDLVLHSVRRLRLFRHIRWARRRLNKRLIALGPL